MSTEIAQRYAQALYDVLPREKRILAGEEFKRVLAVLRDPEIKRFFFHPQTQLAQKKKLIAQFNLSLEMNHFLFLTIEKSRDLLLPQIERAFESLVLAAENTVIAEVVSAITLKPPLLEKIKRRLETLSGKKVQLKSKVDPQIGGGLIIKIGGKVIDGSIASSLKRFQQGLSR
ncbi:MAG: ATP synthase F1 subunit delta [Firmicutes bacterium]|nr:ATP synthase F1 subunit delta [Bacillota bacterium]